MAGYYIPLVGTPQIGDSGGGGGGGTGGGLLVNVIHDEVAGTFTCDKTAGEMAAVLEAGGSIVFKASDSDIAYYGLLETATIAPNNYSFAWGINTYDAASADDYPVSGAK
jgi:hypothetical protein